MKVVIIIIIIAIITFEARQQTLHSSCITQFQH